MIVPSEITVAIKYYMNVSLMVDPGSTQPNDYLLEGKKGGIPRKQAHSKRLKP